MSVETTQEIGMSKRITDYRRLREEIPRSVRAINPSPKRWLDTGCGMGGSVRLSVESFPDTVFTLSDPMHENIQEAKNSYKGGRFSFFVARTDELDCPDGSFDVITSILSSHYYPDRDSKLKAFRNCHRMLSAGGAFILVEHTRHNDQKKADSDWEAYMRSQGLSEESIREMFDRRDTVYFPYTEEDLIAILEEAGFRDTSVFWSTCSDIGLICRK